MPRLLNQLAGPVLGAAMLLGMLGTASLHLTPADAGDYHQRVRQAVEDVPYVVGDWIGHDVPIPTQATDLLKPNATLSRAYVHTRTGQRVSLLLVHCLDARDLQGHYPPECYPAQGWTLAGRAPVNLPTAHGEIEVARYGFSRSAVARPDDRLQVLNLMVLPTGRFSLGMGALAGVAGDHRIRHLGAAELQLVMEESLTPDEQAEAWASFFDAAYPALQVIQSGAATAATAGNDAAPATPGGDSNG